ncbi:MAG: flagellar biosynthetic protein FliO [Nitrospirota bacterium]|nr:flagellar biosynthetic protein FliO [Nitrospirota bacterium]
MDKKRGMVRGIFLSLLMLAPTLADAAMPVHLSSIAVVERDAVLEIGFGLSGEADYQLSFSGHSVQMTLSPVVMDGARQVRDVRHPLLSRVIARQIAPEQVVVRLQTDNFDARQLEGAIRVDMTDSGLRLFVGQELLPMDAAQSAVQSAPQPVASGPMALAADLRNNLPSREAIVAMAAVLVAFLLGGVLARSLLARRRSRGIGNLKVRSELNVGHGRRLLLVETDDRRLLVSMEPAGMRLVADLDALGASDVDAALMFGGEGELHPASATSSLIPEAVLHTPRFSFAETDVRLLHRRSALSGPKQKNMEIAS